jgi:hypothetical protein
MGVENRENDSESKDSTVSQGLQSAARITKNDFTFVIDSDDFPCDRFQAAYLN